MNNKMLDYKSSFRDEAYELLGELESALIELEDNMQDCDLIARIFRVLHTLKGSGAMFGFGDLSEFVHEVENAFELVRDGHLQADTTLIHYTLMAKDVIFLMLKQEKERPPQAQEVLNFLKTNGKEGTSALEDKVSLRTYRIGFKPAQDIFMNGLDPLPILDDLSDLGSCQLTAHTQEIPPLDKIKPESCYTSWDIILTTDQGENPIRDLFIFVEDRCDLTIELIDSESLNVDSEERKPPLEEVLAGKNVNSDQTDTALVEREMRQQEFLKKKSSSIRVDADKLDLLVDLIGELVTVQGRLTQKSSLSADPHLQAIAEEVEQLTASLRENTMSLRMLPIGETFNQFRRLVHDLSIKLGKEIKLETTGGDTELDKNVLEQLAGPLGHLIRNSIDHGIEKPADREAVCKPRKGTISLTAEHSSANVIVTISDDGVGLNADQIKSKAVKKGLIAADCNLSKKEILRLIMEPGFSTTQKVTATSGRGVGLDVVKRDIETLGGMVIIDSETYKKTAISLTLPLTLAIIEGLLTRIGDRFFVLPLLTIEECIELSRDKIKRIHGTVYVRGQIVPFINLRRYFEIGEPPPPIELVIIAAIQGKRIGFLVDEVIGQHQTVIKNLGIVYRKVVGIAGATILGDGSVALVLDLQKISRDNHRGLAWEKQQLKPEGSSAQT